MNVNEWRPIAALLDNLFKDEFDEAREAAYFEVLAPFDASVVHEAVVALSRRGGGPFLPSVREISAAVEDVLFIGTWEWARRRVLAVVSAAVYANDELTHDWVNRRLRQPTPGMRDALIKTHPVYGQLLVALVEDRDLQHAVSTGTYDTHQNRLAWARLLTEHHVGPAPAGPARLHAAPEPAPTVA